MRVGVVSPNILNDIPSGEDSDHPWPFESLAKKASLLFDKIYLTDNLDLTCEIVGGGSAICDGEPNCETLRYLIQRGLILVPQDLGYSAGESFLKHNIKGATARLHRELLKIGNPSNNCGPGEYTYVGQPDIGDWEAHDGTHPRSDKGWNDPLIEMKKRKYESLLLRRNAAILREAGVSEVVIVGHLYESRGKTKYAHPVWNVVISAMPDLDTRAPWEDVLEFRCEERTQHLVRSLRRWIRKIVVEEWTRTELEDEVRELIFEYEGHLRAAGLNGGKGVLNCLITGAAELAEDCIKLRFGKIANLAAAIVDRKAKLMEAEAQAPGRELALLPELKRRF